MKTSVTMGHVSRERPATAGPGNGSPLLSPAVGSPLACPRRRLAASEMEQICLERISVLPTNHPGPPRPGSGAHPGGLGCASLRPSPKAPPGRPNHLPGGQAAGSPPCRIVTVLCHHKEKLIIFSSKPPPPSPAQTITKQPRTTHLALAVFTVFKAVIKRQRRGEERVFLSGAASEGRPRLAAFQQAQPRTQRLSSRSERGETKTSRTASNWESTTGPRRHAGERSGSGF